MKKIVASSRTDLMDKIDSLLGNYYRKDENLYDRAMEILIEDGGSEDDSDPNEGMFAGMTKDQLERAFQDIRNISKKNAERKYVLNLTDTEYSLLKDAVNYLEPRSYDERQAKESLIEKLN